MKPEDVAARVEAIRAIRGDDERAHSMEDELHQDVLIAIAARLATDPAECARVALTTRKIEFARWCA